MSEIQLVSGAISLLGTCTIACKHCYSESGPKVKASFSTNQIIEMLSTLKKHGINQVFLGGGEPFLHDGLEEIVSYMFKENILPSISSNGHAIDSDRLAKLYNAGLRFNLSISLDGPSEVVNRKIRGANSFYKTLLGLYKMSDFNKILWGINYVSCRPNLGHALATANLASTLGASYFNCIKFTPSGRGENYLDELQITDDEYSVEINSLKKCYQTFGDYYDDIYVFDIRKKTQTEKTLASCAKSYFSDFNLANPLGISINHNGDVALAPPNIPLGNIFSSNLNQVLGQLNSEKVQEKYNLWLLGKWTGIHPAKQNI